jgi:hypothetical protein
MTMNEQLTALMETLKELRDAQHPEIPDSLLEEIVTAHAEEPDSPSLHRRVQRALEALSTEGTDAAN